MIGNALEPQAEVKSLRVTEAKPEQFLELELLVVGSPTRAFRPTDAMRSFLKKIPKESLKGVKIAAFDTGIASGDIKSSLLRNIVKIAGYAAQPIAKQLKKKGGELIMHPEEFWVNGEKGPLKDGELERAAEWGRQIDKKQGLGN